MRQVTWVERDALVNMAWVRDEVTDRTLGSGSVLQVAREGRRLVAHVERGVLECWRRNQQYSVVRGPCEDVDAATFRFDPTNGWLVGEHESAIWPDRYGDLMIGATLALGAFMAASLARVVLYDDEVAAQLGIAGAVELTQWATHWWGQP